MGIIMRNGVAYGGGTGDISEFIGTTAEWNVLDASEKAKYKVVNFTDDYSFSPLLIVYTTTGSTVTVAKSGYVVVAKEVESGKFAAEIPEWGTYTITVSLNGATNTETFNVDVATIYEVEIDEPIPPPTPPTPPTPSTITVTIYSATEDTLSYTDINGDTQTIVFSSGQSSKNVDIEIGDGDINLTFTSSIAKNPNNLSNDYSKTVAITSETTEIYIMPENAIYWYGYMSDNFEVGSTANGWSLPPSYSAQYTFQNPTFNTNYIDICPGYCKFCIIGTRDICTLQKVMIITKGITPVSTSSNTCGGFGALTDKNLSGSVAGGSIAQSAVTYIEAPANGTAQGYLDVFSSGLTAAISGYNNQRCYVYALWYE